MNLTKKDLALINHALDITSSDYDPANSPWPDKPESYRVKMQRDIEKLRKKLSAISAK